MGEVVNLRRARKRQQREAAREDAAASRAVHGQSKAERTTLKVERTRREALLDGARVEGGKATAD